MLSGELAIDYEGDESEGQSGSHRVGPGGFFFGARGRHHAFRNVGDAPARVLILSAPSVGLDRMFAELEAAMKAAGGMPDFATLAAITEKYGVILSPPA